MSDLKSNSLWSVLEYLAKQSETELRRILRPHQEAGFIWKRDEETILRRIDIDRALGALTLLEIGLQIGESVGGDPSGTNATPINRASVPAGPFTQLLQSEAFLHYCDSYLYFGVRFLAQRYYPARGAATKKLNDHSLADSNWRPFALETPPQIPADPAIVQIFWGLQREELNDCEKAAQFFLDGYLDKPLDYELWLRGLLEETDEDQATRFESITQGIKTWVERRVDFYLRLYRQDAYEPREDIEGDGFESMNQNSHLPFGPALNSAFSARSIFDKSALGQDGFAGLGGRKRPVGGWYMSDPSAARFGLADFYWIARLLRADVSSAGVVNYSGPSWMHLLRFKANRENENNTANTIFQHEEVLRSVFDFCCDLIQNAIIVTRDDIRLLVEPDALEGRPRETERWECVFGEELGEIAIQRALRSYAAGTLTSGPSSTQGREEDRPDGKSVWGRLKRKAQVVALRVRDSSEAFAKEFQRIMRPPSDQSSSKRWSKRITDRDTPRNLVGIALSGGGIRSATFNLGVLQGLQEFDLLRQVDYISTVSGGGFIGSWLVANVRRSAHWLGRVTDWSASIRHLRAYSDYLAPRPGILSADTWTMAGTWARNAFLIQITGLAWLFALLLIPLEAKQLFVYFASWSPRGVHVCAITGVTLALLLIAIIPYQLYGTTTSTGQRRRSDKWVRWLVVLPSWCVSFCIGSLLWRDAAQQSSCLPCLYELDSYSSILFSAWRPWLWIIALTWFGFLVVGCFSLRRHLRIYSVLISPLCTGVVYLCATGIFYLDLKLAYSGRSENAWYAFVLSPVLILIAYGLGVVLLIGLTGRNSSEGYREWWTRFGTWVAVFAMAGAGLASAAAFSPQLVQDLTSLKGYGGILTSTTVLGWIGTVLSGLFAGKSSKTSGDDKNSSQALQALAAIGGLLFLLGAVVMSSTLLYVLLWKIFTPDGVDDKKVLATFDLLPPCAVPVAFFVTAFAGFLFSHFFEINIFGLNQFYRNRIARCYLGATRMAPGTRKPNSFTGFDFNDDLKLHKLYRDEGSGGLDEANGLYRGPFPIFNCALNLAGSSDLAVKTRHSDSFFLTPLRCGSNRPLVGFAPTSSGKNKFAGGVMLGQAVAVSGAAVSPNMGYNTSPLVAFLLTMFNVRLGWWFPNPGRRSWNNRGLTFSLYYMTRELFGIADERRHYLNVSDGGHFENLGVYELIRRRCKVIIACDAECDDKLQFGGLGNLIRICETDFGATIDLDVKSIRHQEDGFSLSHSAAGKIKYSNGSIGYLIYLKASMTGDEPVSVCQYRSAHPSFPHETTGDQFFSEDQFESYRQLGLHVVQQCLRGTIPGQRPVSIVEKLDDILTPAGCASDTFLKHSAALTALWDKFRQATGVSGFFHELMGKVGPVTGQVQDAGPRDEDAETCMGLELIQLMEDVFLDLRLDDFWNHPDNRGWALLFMRWAQSSRFRVIWGHTRQTFGIRFEHFCAARLGLIRDRPVVRV